jgi:excisionase family DNA binding protein
MTVDEAAHYLGISRQSAYSAARAGRIPIFRVGRRILVIRRALELMLQQASDLVDAS